MQDTLPAPAAPASPPTKPLVWVAFVVFTLGFAFASAWPFFTAWELRYSPAYLASRDWVLEADSIGTLVGPNRYTENDTFPRGGAESEADGANARFEHKLVGDTRKAKVSTLLEKRAGEWHVVRAAWDDEGKWVELGVE